MPDATALAATPSVATPAVATSVAVTFLDTAETGFTVSLHQSVVALNDARLAAKERTLTGEKPVSQIAEQLLAGIHLQPEMIPGLNTATLDPIVAVECK